MTQSREPRYVRQLARLEGWPPDRAVVALDPGLVHGLAILGGSGSVESAEYDWQYGLEVVEGALYSQLSLGARPVLVVEAFFITTETGKKTQAPWSLEGIGVARYLAARYGVRMLTQQPNEAKNFATNRRLKHRGWDAPSPDGHARDALRHLYLYLAKHEAVLPPPGVV